MSDFIIHVLPTLGAVALAIYHKGWWHKIIVAFLLLYAIPAVVVDWRPIGAFSLLLLVACMLAMACAVMQQGLKIIERILIVVISWSLFGITVFRILHWPYANESRLMMVFPLAAFGVYLFVTRRTLPKELGFLFVFGVQCFLYLRQFGH